MPSNIPNEVTVAKLTIEAARLTLEALFEKMKVLPRSEKVIVSETVQEACKQLQAAQELLQQLETDVAALLPPSP